LASIRDVAKRAGVSIATVSYVLNGSRKVSPELREAVLRAVEEMGYIPNAVAKSLREQRTRTLGIVVPDIGNPFFSALIQAFEACAREQGYRVIVASSEEDGSLEEDALLNLTGRQVEGIALVPTQDLHNPPSKQVPLVVLDRLSRSLDVDAVGVENEASAYLATRFLLEQGHRRILVPASDLRLTNIQERIQGYLRALEERGLKADPSLLVECGRGPLEGVRRRIAEAIQRLQPTAVFPITNRLTLATLRAIRELGLRVPQDLSVIGFDDFEWSHLLDPPLTVVAQPVEALGREACRILLQRVLGLSGQGVYQVRLPCTLEVRGSVGPPRRGA
jgi:LacI family transcriptional regulator